MLTRHDYQNALDVQMACNLSGVVFTFAEIMRRLCDESHTLGKGTEWRNKHPIAILFADKIADLSGCGRMSNDVTYHMAYQVCAEKAKANASV